MTNCLHCGATTSNGLALCELSQMAAAKALEFLPVYFRNLARWSRPNRPNGSLGSRGSWLLREGDTGDANRIGKALDEAGAGIATWAKCLHDDRDVELPDADGEAAQTTALCRMLAEHLTSVATLEWCGEFVRQLSEWEERLRRLTITVAPGWYAGACKHCDQPTHVVPGLTWVTCMSCGSTTYARDHLDVILEEARLWIAPPMRLAEAIVALIDGEQSVPRLHKRISKWGEREQIEVSRRKDRDGDPVGAKRYCLGEVIDVLRNEGPTRLDVPADAQVVEQAS